MHYNSRSLSARVIGEVGTDNSQVVLNPCPEFTFESRYQLSERKPAQSLGKDNGCSWR